MRNEFEEYHERFFLSFLLTSLASPTLELADLSAAASKDKINHQFYCHLERSFK